MCIRKKNRDGLISQPRRLDSSYNEVVGLNRQVTTLSCMHDLSPESGYNGMSYGNRTVWPGLMRRPPLQPTIVTFFSFATCWLNEPISESSVVPPFRDLISSCTWAELWPPMSCCSSPRSQERAGTLRLQS